MVPHVLAALGREHEPGSVRRAACLAGEAGFAGAYNADLIFGAAGETMGDWRHHWKPCSLSTPLRLT